MSSFKTLFVFLSIAALSGCKVTEPPPYQADRAPEDRTQYHGMEGLAQHQKDQRYLMDKELADKCRKATIDKAVAESQNQQDDVEKYSAIMRKTCKS